MHHVLMPRRLSAIFIYYLTTSRFWLYKGWMTCTTHLILCDTYNKIFAKDICIVPKMHVLIVGAGLGGLTLAQCLRKQGISFEIFERDEDEQARFQGWAIAIHGYGLFSFIHSYRLSPGSMW